MPNAGSHAPDCNFHQQIDRFTNGIATDGQHYTPKVEIDRQRMPNAAGGITMANKRPYQTTRRCRKRTKLHLTRF